jgi:hypothetical protein
MPEQLSVADKRLAYEVTGQGPSSFSRTGSVTAGTPTVCSPPGAGRGRLPGRERRHPRLW